MKRIKTVVVFFTVLIIITGCTKTEQKTMFAMDTVIQISVSGKNAKAAVNEIEKKLVELENLFSVTNEKSEIASLNKNKTVTVSYDTLEIIKQALTVSEITDGAFDITLYPVISLWGFTKNSYKVPTDSEISEALKKVGSDTVKLDGNTVTVSGEIDLGGIAKGYATQQLRNILQKHYIQSAVISLGGNALVYGNKNNGDLYTIGIQHPVHSDMLIGKVKAKDVSVVTSGGYQRYFESDGNIYHHIIDSKSGKPAKNGIISATVVSENDTQADAFATALYVMGIDKACEFWRQNGSFEMILVTETEVYVTSGLEFELSDQNYTKIIIE